MSLWRKNKQALSDNKSISAVQIISDRRPKSEAQKAIDGAFQLISEFEKQRKRLHSSISTHS